MFKRLLEDVQEFESSRKYDEEIGALWLRLLAVYAFISNQSNIEIFITSSCQEQLSKLKKYDLHNM